MSDLLRTLLFLLIALASPASSDPASHASSVVREYFGAAQHTYRDRNPASLPLGGSVYGFLPGFTSAESTAMTPLARAIVADTTAGDDVVRREVRMPQRLYVPDPLAPPKPYSLRWRMGAGVAEMTPLAFAWPQHRPGWFLNWTLGIIGSEGIPQRIEDVRLQPRPAEAALGMEYVPVVRVKFGRVRFSLEMIAQLAAAHPGRTWIIGNEPDVEAQDWATPEQYAAAYHAVYIAIKAADPTARVAAASLSQITPLRLRYLDSVWRAYQTQFGEEMPVDVWTMHAFVLREEADSWGVGVPPGLDPSITAGLLWGVEDHADLDNVERQVRRMRVWMAAHGQADKPLWITEYGLLLPPELGFTPEVTADFMRGSFDLFSTLRDEETGYAADDHRLVQRWMWFSTNFPEHPAGNLFDETGQPTRLMETMADYLAEHGGNK